MLDIILFVLLIILPFFRIFDGELLQRLHIIFAVGGIGAVFFGIFFNKLDEYLDIAIKYLVPILVSTIAVHFFLRTYDSAQIKITHLEVVGPLILILWLIKRINLGDFKLPMERKYVLVPAILFLLSGIINFIITPYKLQTFEPGLLRRISYVGVFLVIVYEFNRERDFNRVLNWILGSCVIVLIYGFIQELGYDWHVWAGAFAGVFSTFGNPNFFGAWLVIVLPLVMAKAMIKRRWYWGLMILAIFINLYTCGAKGSWLGAAAGVVVFIILATLFLIKGNPKVLKKIALISTISIMVFTILAVVIASFQRPRSVTFRLFTWGATMRMVSEPIYVSPARAVLLGHGIETFRIVYPSYRRPEIFHLEGRHNTQTDHAHNEFMEVLYDEGMLGLTVFLWLLASIYYVAVKRLSLIGVGGVRSEHEVYLVGVIAGTVGVLTHAFVDVNPRFVSTGYILWVMLGLLVVHSAPFKKEKRKSPGLNVGPALIAILGLVGFAVYNSFHASRRFTANKYHNQAISFSRQRRWDRALEKYAKVQDYHPSFIMAYYFEGNVYNDQLTHALNQGNREEAQKYYEKAVDAYKRVRSMFPNYVQLHFQEGMMHSRVGNTQEAIKSFRRYQNIVDPVFPFAYYQMGKIMAEKGNKEKAQWYFQEPVRRKPDEVEPFLNLANIYAVQGKYERAREVYKKGLEHHKDNSELLQGLHEIQERIN